MSDKVRIAIAGCGGISYAHTNGYKILLENGIDNFQITATCDVDKARAERSADTIKQFQGGNRPVVYTDFEQLANDKVADAVDICSSVSSHHTIALTAIKNGMHATIEKPFAITAKAGLKIVQTAEKMGKVIAISENARFSKGVRMARWALDQDYIGEQQMMVFGSTGAQVWYPDKIVAGTPWRHDKMIAGAGSVLDLGSHSFDLIRYLCGEVEEVYGVTKVLLPFRTSKNEKGEIIQKVPSNVDDIAFSVLKFKSGAIGMFGTGWGGHGEATGFQDGFTIQASKGSMKDAAGNPRITLDDGTKIDVPLKFNESVSAEMKERLFTKGIGDTFALELFEFIHAIQTGEKPDNHGWHGLQDIAIAYAITESSWSNLPVKIEDVISGKVDGYQKELNDKYGLD
ncbi:MAG: Gfo/Idh/MocA family oxidoreductase [Candidatus Poribacteria bacterium]